MSSGTDAFLAELANPVPQVIEHENRIFHPGTRVILKPDRGIDLLDISLYGCTAVVLGIEQDDCGNFLIAVIPDSDGGGDLAATRHPAHRFLFSPAELELRSDNNAHRRILIAGIGNQFFGDDGFGCTVAQLLAGRELPAGIEAADFGIRGIDLAYALGRSYDAAILVDVLPPACSPGRIYVMEPDIDDTPAPSLDPHRIDPVAVLSAARAMAELPEKILLVGCEAACIPDGNELSMELSLPVRSAVEKAAEMALTLARELQQCLSTGTEGSEKKSAGTGDKKECK